MQVLRWIVGAALFLVLLLLSLQNSELVTLKFYHWWSWQAPLIFIVLLAFAVGVAAGLLAGAVRSARLKRQLNRLRRERLRSDAPSTRAESAAGQRAEGAARAAGFVPTSGPLNGI
jgi:putative membrane protein